MPRYESNHMMLTEVHTVRTVRGADDKKAARQHREHLESLPQGQIRFKRRGNFLLQF